MFNPFSERAALNDVNEWNVRTFLVNGYYLPYHQPLRSGVCWKTSSLVLGRDLFRPVIMLKGIYLICCSTKQFGGGFVPRFKGRVFEH